MLRLGLIALAAAEEPSVRAGWQDGFKAYAQAVMKDTTGLCDTLTKCVSSMENYFRKYIQDDFTNTYVTVGWCAEPEDNKPDINGNVWWYDGWDDPANGGSDKPYYVVDANWGNVKACNGAGMIMRGIEVDNSISIYANPDYFHTKWDISHEQPMFDYSPHPGCCNPSENRCCSGKQSCNSCNGSTCNWNGQLVTDYTSYCQKGNPCGKADVMQQMWYRDVKDQLKQNPHLAITMCDKVGGDGLGWEDYPTMHEPAFDPNVEGLIAAALFEPLDNTNNIREHVEWDKAPKEGPGSDLGDGDGWEPFKFTQCCSTIIIAPAI